MQDCYCAAFQTEEVSPIKMRGTFDGNFPYMFGGGGSMPAFQGYAHQKGYGIGGIFKGLMRMVIPLAKQAGKSLGKRALKTAAQVAGDIAEGHSIEGAINNQAGRVVKKAAKRVRRRVQRGRGLGRRGVTTSINTRVAKRKVVSKKRRRGRKAPVDVFA